VSTTLTGPSIKRGQSSGDIWTPWKFIHAVEARFGMLSIDLAASGPRSAKALRYITPEDDSLKQDWAIMLDGGLGWDNCPYSNIAPWASKHAAQSQLGARTLLIVPGSIGANWYWDFVEPYSNVYSVGRMVFDNCFDKDGKLVTTVYPKDLILCHYDKSQPRKKMERWRWR
jgi:phage N-6-adenine-methyltransferase